MPATRTPAHLAQNRDSPQRRARADPRRQPVAVAAAMALPNRRQDTAAEELSATKRPMNVCRRTHPRMLRETAAVLDAHGVEHARGALDLAHH